MNDPARTILAYLDQTASDEQVIELERWLRADPAHVTRYLLLAAFHSGLRDQLGPRENSALIEPVNRDTARRSAPMTVTAEATRSGLMLRTLPYAVAAAMLVAAAVVTIYAMAASSQEPASDSPTRTRIATLIDASSTVLVNGESADPGTEWAAGTYAIDSGEAELLLKSRVSVSLRGATRLVVRSPMRAAIDRGAVRFDVPADAVGFTVDLPDGSRIVDLGTTFRVGVDDEGRATLAVLDGVVKWIGSDPASEPVSIRAGQSARLRGGRPVVMSTRLAIDFQNSTGVTASGFEPFDERRATGPGTASATFGDLVVTITGLDRRHRGFFGRGGVTGNGSLTLADLYRDFIYDNVDGQMTLVISGPGIRADAEYLLTFYAYDAGDGAPVSGVGEVQGVSFTGAAGTLGRAGPISYTVGVDPERDDQHASTGIFTADRTGTLTIQIAQASGQLRQRVRLNALVLAGDAEHENEPAADQDDADAPPRENSP